MSGLPNGWTNVAIGELIELNPKNAGNDDMDAGFVPMPLLGTHFRSKPAFSPRRWGDIKKSYTHFADGDVLLAKITPCFENGKAGFVEGMPNGIAAGSSEYFVCRPHANLLHAKYLLALFKTEAFLKACEVQMSGSVGHKRVPREVVVESHIPLAPLREQQRIVDKLDALLARVDVCRERLDRVPSLLGRFRQSVLAAATTGKLSEEWLLADGLEGDVSTVTYDGDEIEVPSHWNVTTLRAVIDPARPLCYGVVQPGEERKGGVPLIRVQDMEGGRVLTENLRTISNAVDAEYRRSRIKTNDLLISVVGTIGRIAIVPKDLTANIARAVARVSCRETIHPLWIKAWLSSNTLQWWLSRSSREVARKTLNLSELGDVTIALPPPHEQTEIVRRVEALLALADRIEQRYKTTRAQVDKLTPALLAKAFRGELVPQDPNDEPTSALLARIRAGNSKAEPKRRGRARSAASRDIA